MSLGAILEIDEGKDLFYKAKPIEYIVTEKGCWECISHCRNKGGYAGAQRGGKKQEIHRYLFSSSLGRTLGYSELVCHICHNPKCINIAHMYLGNKSTNALDAVGVGTWNKKLSEEDVKYIKSVWGQRGITADSLGEKFGVTKHAIYHITKKENNTWGYL